MVYKQVNGVSYTLFINSFQFQTISNKKSQNKMKITINTSTPSQVPIDSLSPGSLFKDDNGDTFILLSVGCFYTVYISIKDIGKTTHTISRDYNLYPWSVTPLTLDQANTHISLNIATQDK